MASRAEVRVFTLAEANRATDELKKTLPLLRKILRDIEKIEDRLEVLDLICNRSVASNNPDLQEYLKSRVRYHRKISEFEGILNHLDDSGYLLRDLDKGIVHFIGRKGDENVLLCWKEGEKAVSHWHALAKGEAPKEENRLDVKDSEEF